MTDRLRAYVVDDEPGALRQVVQSLKASGRVDVVGTATSGETALLEIPALDVDAHRLERRRGDPAAGSLALLDKLARHYLQASPPLYADRISLDLGQQRTQLVEIAKVTHFLAQGKGTVAVTAAGSHLVDHALGELGGRLDPRQFVRIHRSAIVNMAWVAEVQPDLGGRLVVQLKDAARTELHVARERARAFKDA